MVVIAGEKRKSFQHNSRVFSDTKSLFEEFLFNIDDVTQAKNKPCETKKKNSGTRKHSKTLNIFFCSNQSEQLWGRLISSWVTLLIECSDWRLMDVLFVWCLFIFSFYTFLHFLFLFIFDICTGAFNEAEKVVDITIIFQSGGKRHHQKSAIMFFSMYLSLEIVLLVFKDFFFWSTGTRRGWLSL